MEVLSSGPGLRERKKQKTRDTIVRVALKLFDERGYEQTTIAEIAEAAEVSPRTIFAYFPSKEDILFNNLPEAQGRLAQALRGRLEGVTAFETLREFVAEWIGRDPDAACRKRIVASDETLRRSERARMAPFEQLMIEAIAKDLDTGPDDIRPQIVAAALIATFSSLADSHPVVKGGSLPPEDAMAVIDQVLTFLRGGLDALRDE
jgi:AcrR family transcriptional regulator